MSTNPPITIGPFTNVPAPGSGVKSDWAQQITSYVVGRGEIAYIEQPAAIGPFGPAVSDIAGLAVTFVAVAGAKYEIVGSVEMSTNHTANANLILILADAANTIIQARNHTLVPGGYGSFTVIRRVSPAAGSVTYKLRAQSNLGTLQANDGPNNIGVLRVHRIG